MALWHTGDKQDAYGIREAPCEIREAPPHTRGNILRGYDTREPASDHGVNRGARMQQSHMLTGNVFKAHGHTHTHTPTNKTVRSAEFDRSSS